MNYKVEVFEEELSYIKDLDVKLLVSLALVRTPDYFFEIPASSSGKYHPQYALGEGGLVRHTKAAVRIAHMLLGLEMYKEQFNDITRDIIIAALILHDTRKSGDTNKGYTVSYHPQLAKNFLKKDKTLSKLLKKEDFNTLLSCIESHMGEWNTISKTKTLPKPISDEEKFVHMCDYLASRKNIEVLFE